MDDSRNGDSSHRFTDREIALLLQRAAEIEAQRSDPAIGPGMSLRQLREIALEVGISPEVFEEAATAVQAGVSRPQREMMGAPLTYKAARGVPGKLDSAQMERLIRVLEEAMDQTGTLSEALGTVRWTSLPPDRRFDPTTQVSLLQRSDEMQISVVRRHPEAIRAILHILPMVWGGALFAAIAAGMNAAPMILLAGGVSFGVLGLGVGHTIWQRIATRSAAMVQRLASTLATAATDIVEDEKRR